MGRKNEAPPFGRASEGVRCANLSTSGISPMRCANTACTATNTDEVICNEYCKAYHQTGEV